MDVYECFRFWAFSSEIISNIRRLDLCHVLGLQMNLSVFFVLLNALSFLLFLMNGTVGVTAGAWNLVGVDAGPIIYSVTYTMSV